MRMSESIQVKRTILIVHPSSEWRDVLTNKIGSHVANCNFYYSQDGSEAMLKIQNDPPHIVVVAKSLSRTTTEHFIQWCLDTRKKDNFVVIVLSSIPDKEDFVDAVALGRLHFLSDPKNDKLLSQVMARSLNYLSQGESTGEFKLVFLAPGDQLLKKGEKGENVYIVKHGKLRASAEEDGKTVFLGNINPGEFVGEMAYINGEPRSADVTAESDCELIEIPMNTLDHLLFQKPAWSKALMKTLSKRLKVANIKKSIE